MLGRIDIWDSWAGAMPDSNTQPRRGGAPALPPTSPVWDGGKVMGLRSVESFSTLVGDDDDEQRFKGDRNPRVAMAPTSASLSDLKNGLGGRQTAWKTVETLSDEKQAAFDIDVPNYRPGVLRLPFLVALIIVIVILIALSEVCVHILPRDDSPVTLLPRSEQVEGQLVEKEYRVLSGSSSPADGMQDELADGVITIVEITTVTLEVHWKRGIFEPGDSPSPDNLAEKSTIVSTATIAAITPAPGLNKRGWGAPLLTNTWINLGSVTVEEVIWWSVDASGQAYLFTRTELSKSTPQHVGGGGDSGATGGAGGGGGAVVLISTISTDAPANPEKGSGDGDPALPAPQPVTVVVSSDGSSFTAVIPPTPGAEVPAPLPSATHVGGVGAVASAIAGTDPAPTNSMNPHSGQSGLGREDGFSTLVFSSTDSKGNIVLKTMAVANPGSEALESDLLPASGYLTGYLTGYITTLLDSAGHPTATYTVVPNTIALYSSLTLTNADGVPTATITGDVLETTLITLPPVATPTASPNGSVTQKNVYFISSLQYFLGAFVPTLLAMALSIFIRALDLSAKRYQAFHALTSPQGATPSESLCLDNMSMMSWLVPRWRAPLSLLSTLLVLVSMVVTSLSSEVLGFQTHGSCTAGGMSAANCAITLAVFPAPANVVVALLVVMAALLFAVLFILRKWKSGVAANPWSVAGLASLAGNRELVALFDKLPSAKGTITGKEFVAVLGERRFKLARLEGREEDDNYGVVVLDENPPKSLQKATTFSFKNTFSFKKEKEGTMKRNTSHHLAFLMLTYWSRILFLLFILGLLAVILYYNNTGGPTPFENFMDDEGFGVKFLFTLIGVLITLSWGSFFSSVAIMSPYKAMYENAQPASRSVLLPPPDDAFTGLFDAIKRRHAFMIVVAITAILSEFLPVLLNSVPSRVTQTFIAQMWGIWGSVGILCIMILVMVGSFFIKWPHMPVDPSTIAGTMYYVYDSGILQAYEGLSLCDVKKRDGEINAMKGKYILHEIRDRRGRERMRIDMIREGDW